MQRGGQHGRGQSTQMQPSDTLTPTLPPLYPTTVTSPAPMPQSAMINEALQIQKKMTKYFLTNYTVSQIKEKYKSAFAVERYSDRYNSPSISNLHVVHRAKSNRYPAELSAKDIRLSRKSRKMFTVKRLKRNSTDMDGNEDKEKDSDDDEVNLKAKKTEVSNLATDDEDDDDVDEEMDVGNDYMVDHFDNGEDFQDNDALDAGGYGDGDDSNYY